MWTLADLPVTGALLGAGGGTGRVAQFMIGKANPVLVADLSNKMLSEANQKGSLNLICSHTERLSFPNGAFARIIMVDVFHHVCDQRETVDELCHALQPSGRLINEEPDVRTFAVKLITLAEELALMRGHFLTSPRIAEMFHFPNASVHHIETEKSNTWVIVKKEKKL